MRRRLTGGGPRSTLRPMFRWLDLGNGWRGAAALWLTIAGCTPNTDLTVAPPTVKPKIEVEVPEPLVTGRLPDFARPVHYDLALEIDPALDRFAGEVTIDVTLDRPSAAFVLHAAGLRISRAEVASVGASLPAEPSSRRAAGAADESDELVLTTNSAVPAGPVQLRLWYTGPLDEVLRGVYRVQDGDARYVFTQFEPIDARRMFPSFDDPIYKTTFDIKITTPRENQAFSNAPLVQKEDEGDKTTFTFATSKKMPTYLVALAIGPLEAHAGATTPVPIRVVAPKGREALAEHALDTAARQLEILTELFGPYPYEKLDLVAVPNFGPGAMENAGLVTFREELLLLDTKTASAKSRRDHALIVAHELAHMWFGNLVTMKWWDDLWLNEGFATYVEVLVAERYDPSLRADLELLSLEGWVMGVDALSSARAVRQPIANSYQAEEAFDGITYVKGASVIKMIHRWIGDEAFLAGIRSYMTKHAWGNAGASDMFDALGSASGKAVAETATTFLDKGGVPLVRATMTCKAGKAPRVDLSQQRYRGVATTSGVADDPLWRIPVCVAWPRKGRKEVIERTCVELSERATTLELSTTHCPSWLLPNAGYDGYYRYALPVAELDALATASAKHDTMQRIGLLSNAWALVQSGDLPATKLLDLLRARSKEDDRAVVEEIIATLEHVSDALVERAARPRFEQLVQKLLLPTAQRLGWDQRPGDSDDDRLARRNVLLALATLTDDPWMLREAEPRARAWLADPTSVDADTAVIALRVAAHAGVLTFGELTAALGRAETASERTTLIPAFGSLRDEADLKRALSLLLDGTIRAQDAIYVTRAAAEWPSARAVLIAWLEKNLAALAKKAPGFGVARMLAPLSRLCDAKSRAAAAKAFEPIVMQIGGSERRLREAIETADMCIDLRGRQSALVSAYLSQAKF